MSRGDQAYTGMTDRRPYTYVLLRYRHDPLAGEFANVGVLLHEPGSGYLDAKVRTTLGPRLTKMFPTLDGDAFKGSFQSVGRSVSGLASASWSIVAISPVATLKRVPSTSAATTMNCVENCKRSLVANLSNTGSTSRFESDCRSVLPIRA